VTPKPKRVIAAWDESQEFAPDPYTSKIIELFPPIKVKVPFRKKVKLMDGEEIVLSDETKALLEVEATQKGCFLCRFILEDFAAKGKLTGYPNDIFEKGTFPVEAKIRHIEILKYNLPSKVTGQAKPAQSEEQKEESDGE
jgi:hypothetical protein